MKSMAARGGKSFLRDFVSIELTVRDGFIDSREVLEDDAAGAQIEMADFGIAHLSIRKSYIGAAGAEFATRMIAIKLIVKRRFREQGGVAVLLPQFLAARVNSPAVSNDQDDGAGHRRNVATIVKRDKRFFR